MPKISHAVPMLLLALVLLSAVATALAEPQREVLFIVARSKNANVVRYELRRNPDGQLNPDAPIVAYWLMHAEDGRREGLTWFERQFAYGWSVSTPVRKNGFELRLAAFDTRPLSIARDGRGSFAAYLNIGGQRAVLRRLYIKTDERGVTPRVEHVDLFGVKPGTNEPVSQRIYPE